MKCKEAEALISLMLDGRLDAERETLLERHCAGCARCARKLALQRSAEERARGIGQAEPPAEYWDTFSSRVMARIEAGRERGPVSALRKALSGIVAFPTARARLAAGVVSIAVVAALGMLYLSRHGGDIVPPREGVSIERREGPAESGSAAVLDEERQGVPPEAEEKIPGEAEKIEEGKGEKDALAHGEEETGVGPKGKEEDIGAVPSPAKAPPAETQPAETAPPAETPLQAAAPKTEKEAPAETPAETPAATPAEAPAETPPPLDREPPAASSEEAAPLLDTTAFYAAKSRDRAKITLADRHSESAKVLKSGTRSVAAANRYDLDGTVVAAISERDTAMAESDLRMLIRTWTAYIEENPHDPLAREGYVQAATAYYLLARRTLDEAVISEGSRLIETYAAAVDDPQLRAALLQSLRGIEALRAK